MFKVLRAQKDLVTKGWTLFQEVYREKMLG